MCAFYTAGLVEMLKTVDSQRAGFPDLRDLKAQEMANIVENMFIQSPYNKDLAFKETKAMYIFNVKYRSKQE